MTTLAEFRAIIRDAGNFPANDTRITDTVVDREINRALKRIALRHDWPWLQAERTIVTTGDQRSYAMPTDVLRILSVRFPDCSYTLPVRAIQEIDDISRGTGQPQVYAVWGDRFHFGPTPNGEYTIKVRYIRRELVLVQDTDAPLIPDYWNDGVIEGALMQLHREVNELDKSGLSEARFNTWLAESQDNIKQTREIPRVRVRPGSSI